MKRLQEQSPVRIDRIELRLEPPCHGWVNVSLRLGDFELSCAASTVLNDPLAELLDCTSFVRDGTSGFRRVCWWTEPDGYVFDLKHLTETEVMITVSYDKMMVPPASNDRLKNKLRCIAPRTAALEALSGALRDVLGTPATAATEGEAALLERLRVACAALDARRSATVPTASTSALVGAIAPFFIVKDVSRSLAFYRDALGFDVLALAPDEEPFFALLGRGGACLIVKAIAPEIQATPNPARHAWARWDASVDVPDPDALAAEYASRGVAFHAPLTNTEDGLRGFETRDPDGYVIFFGRSLEDPNS